ncbi:MAG: alpha/beta fold hydrolase [Vicinamibacterales bacterium]
MIHCARPVILFLSVAAIVWGTDAPAAQSHTTSHAPAAAQAAAGAPLAPLLDGLGTHHRPVTTTVPRAQAFFDQGLRLLYAFNFLEADRSFREAARLDPALAMASWGRAMALGPNINAPMTVEDGRAAFAAAQRARELKAGASPVEQALIDAVALRFAPDGAGDRDALDQAYAARMQELAAAYPDDSDIGTLAAAAFMQTIAWDYWAADGTPRPGVLPLMASMEALIARHPSHAGLHHYYIHLVEASDRYHVRAEKSADALVGAMPGAGHMVHMPSHIYLRVGRYADAIRVNQDAALADEDYIAQCRAQGLYPVAYYPHNIHFLWTAGTVEGRSVMAIDAARKVADKVPHHMAGALAWTHDFPVVPFYAYVRFGRWEEILSEPRPHVDAPYPQGVWHYARALARIARGELGKAREELAALEAARADRALETTFAGAPLAQNLDIALEEVRAELAARDGDWETAIAAATRGVTLQDAQPYNEPETWHRPVRLVLGGILIDAGRYAEAEPVFREDLRRHPETGWALIGLAQSLRGQGKRDEARLAEARFQRAWARADIALTGSRFASVVRSATDAAPRTTTDRAAMDHALGIVASAVPPGSTAPAGTGAATAPTPSCASCASWLDAPERTRREVRLRNGVRLSYVEQGPADGRVLLLLHGYTDSAASWARVMPMLPQAYRVIAIDQRGHGHSDRPRDGYSMPQMARDAVQLLDALGIERAVVVGHSMGSLIARQIAVLAPERVDRLVLVGTAERVDPAGVEELVTAVRALEDPIDRAFIEAFQASTVVDPVPTWFDDLIIADNQLVPARVWQAAVDGILATDASADPTQVRVPTLVVGGDKDAFFSEQSQRALAARIPGARVAISRGIGHAPHWEEPEVFVRTLLAFLEPKQSDR